MCELCEDYYDADILDALVYDDVMTDMNIYYEDLQRKEAIRLKRCMDIAGKYLTDNKKEELLQVIADSEYTNRFSITNKCPIKQTWNDHDTSLTCYLNQYTNGGYEGDSFAGQIWIKLTDKHYLTFHYSM